MAAIWITSFYLYAYAFFALPNYIIIAGQSEDGKEHQNESRNVTYPHRQGKKLWNTHKILCILCE